MPGSFRGIFGFPLLLFGDHDRQSLFVAPFAPTAAVIAYTPDAHEFQGKSHHRGPPTRLAIADRRTIEFDAGLGEQAPELAGILEAICLRVDQIVPLEMLCARDCTTNLVMLLVDALKFGLKPGIDDLNRVRLQNVEHLLCCHQSFRGRRGQEEGDANKEAEDLHGVSNDEG